MRRAAILLSAIALAMVVGGGVAVAATVRCDGGHCSGTNRPDSIFGTNRHDAVFARDGGDFVSGRGRADNLNGEHGNDEVLGGWGDDWVKGGRGDDVAGGGLGNDRITGGSGHNVIRAGDGMRDLIVCGDDSRNLIFYDPRLDRFSNCVFIHKSVQANGSGESAVVGRGPSRPLLGPGALLQKLRPPSIFKGVFNRH
jgi:Ca2+-binding RTX toxin-like protein